MGMSTTWATPYGGVWGLLAGTLASVLHCAAYSTHVICYGNDMSAEFLWCGYSLEHLLPDNDSGERDYRAKAFTRTAGIGLHLQVTQRGETGHRH
jgi:hypothetical protein